MSKWARIENGIVMETTDLDPTDRFHPSLLWVPCAENISYLDGYENGSFTKHVEPTLPTPEQMQQAMTGDIDPAVLAAAEEYIKLGDN